jgi:copper resistance protein C
MNARPFVKSYTLGAARIVLFAALMIPIARATASAHARVKREEPRRGSVVSPPPRTVMMEFDAPVERLFAKLDVVDAAARNCDDGVPQVSDDGTKLTVQLKPLVPGSYEVRWSVVSRDGHRSHGSYRFAVGQAASP